MVFERIRSCLLWALLCGMAHFAGAQAPTTIIVPYPAGGSVDALARIIAHRITEQTGEAFVIDNRPGSNGLIGARAAAQARPDGKTWLFAADALVTVNPLLYPRHLALVAGKDFLVVRGLALQQSLLFVHPGLAVKSMREFVDHARHTEVAYGSAGNGSPGHLMMELLGGATGIRRVHVPYKGGNLAMVDLIAGRLQASFAAVPVALEHVKAGKLVPLAVAAAHRATQLPGVPTTAEAGFPGLEAETGAFVMLPAGASRDTVARVDGAVAAALADPDIQERIVAAGWLPQPRMDGRQAGQWLDRAASLWSGVIRRQGIKAE